MSQFLVVLLHLNAELLYFDNELYHPYSFHSSDLPTTLIYSFVSILSVIFSLLSYLFSSSISSNRCCHRSVKRAVKGSQGIANRIFKI